MRGHRLLAALGIMALTLGAGCSARGVVGLESGFDGEDNPDPSAQPRWVYPLEGALLARNVGRMNLQWSGGAGNRQFRIRVEGASRSWRLSADETVCPEGKCQLRVDDETWREIASAAAGGSVTLTLDAVDVPGGRVARSGRRSVSFSERPVEGQFFYFGSGNTNEQGALLRAQLTDGSPQTYLDARSRSTGGLCVGCHAVTRDGCRVSANTLNPAEFVFGQPETRRLLVSDADDGERQFSTPGAHLASFQTWSPDGSRLLTVFDGRLSLRDANGELLTEVDPSLAGPPGEDVVTHPEWSPDGRWVVLTRLATGQPKNQDIYHAGDILLMPYADGVFGPARVLVPHTSGSFHFYPSFSPDSRWVVFSSGDEPDPFDQVSARLRLVSVDGGPPVELARATYGTHVTASWPKFAPYFEKGRAFIVFSSKLDYGWVVEQATRATSDPFHPGWPQLWAAAVDLGA
ncbi:MAG TPA: hypothetical protein VEY30_13975, partial [Myxococcaceae bacterium]|nr:hypothetical protein [Myxococcaceae bacterium]